ncbi:MAG: endopeptidase La [Clostridium sp.]
MPLLPIRGIVVFPYTVSHFDVGREKSLAALESAMQKDKHIFLTSQSNELIEEPTREDLADSGTVAIIKQVLKLQNGVVRVLVEGLYKADIKEITSTENYYTSIITSYDEIFNDIENTKALARYMKKLFTKYAKSISLPLDSGRVKLTTFEDIEKYTYRVAAGLVTVYHLHEEIINKDTLEERIEFIIEILQDEVKIIGLEQEIGKRTKEKMDKHQREYFLKQQLRVIQEELGDKEDLSVEIEKIKAKMIELKLPKNVCEKLESEIKKLEKTETFSAESGNIRTYIETVLSIPWKKLTKDTSISKVQKVLEKEHYGLDDVKERILEYIAVRKLNNGLKGPIICLVGPPGVGKTSIARSIANSMNRKFVRMSLGGVRDEAEIRGHRRTYVSSIPGRIITNMKEAGVLNPVFLLDEIDKMSDDYKGDPASAMLEVLDPEQNNTFKDHYLEIEYDLSKVLFVTTANSLSTIPRPLLDRMEIIEVAGYTDVEKLSIAKDYLVDKQVAEHGIKKGSLKITGDALKGIIEGYTRESGVRSLQRQIAKVCRKSAIKYLENNEMIINIDKDNLEECLGPAKYKYNEADREDQIGTVLGLAWTQYGGDTLPIEVAIMKGTGKLELTGKLGDVMKESAKIGYSYIRANTLKYGIDEDFYKKLDIHIHAPEGAIPKDGPSAGVTMITAMVSALTKKPIRCDVAMTGEVTLTGNVLAIGGIKEKALSAYRIGIKTIILPEENRKDIAKIPSYIKDNITFIFAKKVDVVLNAAIRGGTNDN